jgi:hypothetical protein
VGRIFGHLRSSVTDDQYQDSLLHDLLYGEGKGRMFLRGAYPADLPRAYVSE